MKLQDIGLFESTKFFTNKDAVIIWIRENTLFKHDESIIKIHDGKVDINADIFIRKGVKSMGINIETVNGTFYGDDGDFESWAGMPIKCSTLYVGSSTIKDVTGFPSGEYDGIHLLQCTAIETFKGIHKSVKKCTIMFAPPSLKRNILGLILIDGMKRCTSAKAADKKLLKALEIVEKYLGQGQQGVVKAQRELIDADLDEYAEL